MESGKPKGRVAWHKIRAEYINGASQSKLSEKYGVSRTAISKHCVKEKWTDKRYEAQAEITQRVIQKTAETAADNATLAADIKRKGLLILARLFDDYLQVNSTEHREYIGQRLTDIKRLRDLTAAYKDLTEDMATGTNEGSELLKSLIELERGLKRD